LRIEPLYFHHFFRQAFLVNRSLQGLEQPITSALGEKMAALMT
jgi:hypothetical protein